MRHTPKANPGIENLVPLQSRKSSVVAIGWIGCEGLIIAASSQCQPQAPV
jgi:hypothetical protein